MTDRSSQIEHVVQLPPVLQDERVELSHRLPVRNHTSRHVTFTGVHHKCTCTGASLGTKELDPGEETTLTLTARLAGRTGPQRFSCVLVDELGASWNYGIETTIYRNRQFSEDTLYLGIVEPNGSLQGKSAFWLHSKSRQELEQAVRFESDSPAIGLVAGKPTFESLSGGIHLAKIPIEIKLTEGAATGPPRAAIRAHLSGRPDPFRSDLRQELTWSVRPLLVAEPRQVFFGPVDRNGDPSSRRVQIRRVDGLPLRIRAIRHSVVGVTLKHEIQSSIAAELTVTMTPSQVNGSQWQLAESCEQIAYRQYGICSGTQGTGTVTCWSTGFHCAEVAVYKKRGCSEQACTWYVLVNHPDGVCDPNNP